jgi:ABC-type transport system substrate-binding protein
VQGWLRPNFLHPPFNNKKAREALLHMMDQVTYLAWAIGQADYYRTCYSVFACGGPYMTRIGSAPMVEHDLARARQLVKESGYDGEPIVVLQVTDRPWMNAAAVVTRQRLESIGFKVILKAMNWSTNLAVRARREPPDRGGWTSFTRRFMRRTSSIPRSISLCRARGRARGLAGQTFRRSRSLPSIGCARRMNPNGCNLPTKSRELL